MYFFLILSFKLIRGKNCLPIFGSHTPHSLTVKISDLFGPENYLQEFLSQSYTQKQTLTSPFFLLNSLCVNNWTFFIIYGTIKRKLATWLIWQLFKWQKLRYWAIPIEVKMSSRSRERATSSYIELSLVEKNDPFR